MMMQEQVREDAGGAILFDAAASPQVDSNWFAQAYWSERGALRTQPGGRGGIAIVDTPAGECVLKHYRRGGMVAALMGDRYLWSGADHTRGFQELRLLGAIAELGLPGPRPVATRYVRHGLFYSADLLTGRIQQASTLAEYLAQGRLDSALAAAVGDLVARFHRVGIWHADLNAHNVLRGSDADRGVSISVIDFDRGRLRAAGSWQQGNLARLKRSLTKISRSLPSERFTPREWGWLEAGYGAA